jgi:hypothetical protein
MVIVWPQCLVVLLVLPVVLGFTWVCFSVAGVAYVVPDCLGIA